MHVIAVFVVSCTDTIKSSHCYVISPFLTEPCPFGNVYNLVDEVGTGPLKDLYECNSIIRLHGATTVNITFTFFDIEGLKDVLWFYPGFASDTAAYPGFDNVNLPANITNGDETNFWVEIYTDRTITSEGFNISISAGKY